MAGMIALELNSVTRIHDECIRFLSLMVKCQLHIIMQNFCFLEYCTGGLVRSENEAKILYTVEKRLYFAV